jgi:hypothetical protein
LIVRYQGETYDGVGVKIAPREGRPVGTGMLPGCEEREPDEEIELAEIDGVPPQIALAWHGDPTGVFISQSVEQLPPELRRLMHAPKVRSLDEPIDLAGPWLGIVGPTVEATRSRPMTSKSSSRRRRRRATSEPSSLFAAPSILGARSRAATSAPLSGRAGRSK